MDSFRALSILPSKSDLLTILQMEGRSWGGICFMREVGTGSRAQNFDFPFIMIFSISLSETRVNDSILGKRHG